jgi:hypothetical protein
MSTICNPVAAAEIVGREYIESQIPSNNSYKVNNLIDNIRRVNERVGDIDVSKREIQRIHGPYNGAGAEFVSFTKNLFGNDPEFVSTILELERSAIALNDIVSNVGDAIDTAKTLTMSEVSTALMRGYLRNVETLLPKSISNTITNNLSEFPLFTEISETLGSVYYNIALSDNAIDMVDSIIGDTLDATGLSNILTQHDWIRMLPEYAANFHNNTRLFQRLATRIMPKCSYANVFHVMDEPLAHLYDLARDSFSFLDILSNRKKYIKFLIDEYGDLLRKINNIYPLCHEYSLDNLPTSVNIGGDNVLVDYMGDKIYKTDNFNSVLDVYESKKSLT